MSHSKSGGASLEAKYLRKALDSVDSRIELPDSLRGQALLCKLEGVKQDIPANKKIMELIFPRQANVRSLLAYAAALVLVIGMFYSLGTHRPWELTVGRIPLEQETELQPLSEGGGMPGPSQDYAGTTPYEQVSGLAQPGEITDPGSQTLPEPQVGGQTTGGYPDIDGMGGAGMGTRLGQLGDYVLTYRPNDATDPDHLSNAPNVLFLLDPNSDAIVSQVDIPYMSEIASFYVSGSVLTLVGAAEGMTFIHSLDYTLPSAPVSLLSLDKPGALSAKGYFDGFLYVASHSADLQQRSPNSIVLQGSDYQSTSTLTLINLAQNAVYQTCILGAGKEILLERTGAQIFYTADSQQRVASLDITSGDTLQATFVNTQLVSR